MPCGNASIVRGGNGPPRAVRLYRRPAVKMQPRAVQVLQTVSVHHNRYGGTEHGDISRANEAYLSRHRLPSWTFPACDCTGKCTMTGLELAYVHARDITDRNRPNVWMLLKRWSGFARLSAQNAFGSSFWPSPMFGLPATTPGAESRSRTASRQALPDSSTVSAAASLNWWSLRLPQTRARLNFGSCYTIRSMGQLSLTPEC